MPSPGILHAAAARQFTNFDVEAVDILDGPRYRFAHPLFLMRLYDLLRSSERRDLHRKITEVVAPSNGPWALEPLA